MTKSVLRKIKKGIKIKLFEDIYTYTVRNLYKNLNHKSKLLKQ